MTVPIDQKFDYYLIDQASEDPSVDNTLTLLFALAGEDHPMCKMVRYRDWTQLRINALPGILRLIGVAD